MLPSRANLVNDYRAPPHDTPLDNRPQSFLVLNANCIMLGQAGAIEEGIVLSLPGHSRGEISPPGGC